jgi:hypothetical protein
VHPSPQFVLRLVRNPATYALLALMSSIAAFTLLLGMGVNRTLDFRGRTAGTDSIRLILDSPDVRQLIAHQETMEKQERLNLDRVIRGMGKGEPNPISGYIDLSLHPERYIPGRLALIAAMNQQPAVTVVARRSYCRFLKHTRASCSKDPILDCYYIKVRITSGPSKGQEGWSCMFEDVALTGPIAP